MSSTTPPTNEFLCCGSTELSNDEFLCCISTDIPKIVVTGDARRGKVRAPRTERSKVLAHSIVRLGAITATAPYSINFTAIRLNAFDTITSFVTPFHCHMYKWQASPNSGDFTGGTVWAASAPWMSWGSLSVLLLVWGSCLQASFGRARLLYLQQAASVMLEAVLISREAC